MPHSPENMKSTMTAWRHDFHRHPELGFDLPRTATIVANILREAGIEVTKGVGGSGVVGVLKRGMGNRSIGMRADMDALAIFEKNTFAHRSQIEGRMHACGHDGHTSMLLGAACHLAEHGTFEGTATFIFQPAEEHGKGALAMIDDGLFERFPVDDIYAIHNMPSIPTGNISMRVGPIMACEDNFKIIIQGKGAHAAMPHMGIDPIVIGSEIVSALQTVVSRTIPPVQNAVISVTDFKTEGTRNVIPDSVTLLGDTRSFGGETQNLIEVAMERVVSGVCAAHGASYEFNYSREFAATINTMAEAAIAKTVAEKVIGTERVTGNCEPVMGSEDFGFMLHHKPGCYLFLGNGGDGPGGCGLHNAGYDFNDEILTVGAEFWVQLVQSQLARKNQGNA